MHFVVVAMSSFVNQVECFVRTAVPSSCRDFLFEKITGLCHAVDIPIHVSESVFKAEGTLSDLKHELRVKQRLRGAHSSWSVFNYSVLALGVKGFFARSVVEVAVSENVLSFLDNLGYTCDFRFEQDGTESVAFFNDRSFIITVTKVFVRFSKGSDARMFSAFQVDRVRRS